MKAPQPPAPNLFRKIPVLRRLHYYYSLNWIKNNPDAEVYYRITDNLKMLLTVKEWIQQCLFIYGYFELAETAFWKKITLNKSTVFDIGANIGYFSLLASKRIKRDGKIYAFEPVNRTYTRAKINIELNHFENIILSKLALSDHDRKLIINSGNEDNWGMSSINVNDQLKGFSEEVQATSVDNFVAANGIKNLDVAKIDVEGGELFTLKGMTQTIDKMRPVILIEVLDETLIPAGTSKEEVFKFITDKNYKPYKILNNCQLKELEKPVSEDGLICFYPVDQPFDNFIKLV